MRILFCGDLVGRAGRTVVTDMLPRLRRDLALDFVVVNGENAAGGFGITEQICQQLHGAGADVITTAIMSGIRRELSSSSTGSRGCCGPRIFRPARPVAASTCSRPPMAGASWS